MVETLDSLTETTATQALEHLVPVNQMVVHYQIIVASIVVEPEIVLDLAAAALDLLDLGGADIVNLRKGLDLYSLIVGQQLAEMTYGLTTGDRQYDSLSNRRAGLLGIGIR